MDYSQYDYQGNYHDQYAQPQQYSVENPPQIRNPFATANGMSQPAAIDPEHEAQLAQWNSMYASTDADLSRKSKAKDGTAGGSGPAAPKAVNIPPGEKQLTVVRKGGGKSWEDNSLLEWDPAQFRIMVGNLAGEVTDDSLAKAFSQYGVAKARVVRDKRTTKSKGFGFVSFTDGEMGFKAAREMDGKYIGSHPVTIQRSKTDLRPTMQKNNFQKNKNHKNRSQNSGKGKAKDDGPLRANTGAHIEKKPVRNAAAYKVIG